MSRLFSISVGGVVGGGGITSINSDSTAAQTLAVGTSGTDFAIADGGSGAHTFNLPTASASNRGAVSTTDWSRFNNARVSSIGIALDGAGSALTTGIKGDVSIPFSCTINSVTLLADQSGSIVFDLWKDTYANYPPTVADTITASAKPTISSDTKATDSTLTGWTTSITAGDTIRFNIDSVSTITRCTLVLKVTKT